MVDYPAAGGGEAPPRRAVPDPRRSAAAAPPAPSCAGVTPGLSGVFIAMGLRPGHMKAVAWGLRETFAVEVTAGELMRCGCVREVERVLRQ